MSNLDWKNLGFGYIKTKYNVRAYFKDGSWSSLEVTDSERLDMHISATCLHYGQEIFEGLKAYRGSDGKVRLFRWKENAYRFAESAKGIMMQPVPEKLFEEAIKKAVELNQEFIPPYGTGATLYIRPILLGTSIQVGVKPANEYTFIVFVTPVGPYFKDGFKPVDICILRDTDRAAPLGTGRFKVGGNYAASLTGNYRAISGGFSAVLYLDAKEKKYLDECGPANFFGIKNNTYITPQSTSILPSITNDSLIEIAKDMGIKVERRLVPVVELEEFEEVGACGTAAVISPIKAVYDLDMNKVYTYCKDGNPGEISTKLYNRLVDIQFGNYEDTHQWIEIIG